MHTSAGRFLGYTAMDKNIIYMDSTTRRIKITTHCTFDEAGAIILPKEQSPAMKALQQVGATKPKPEIITDHQQEQGVASFTTEETNKIKHLSDLANHHAELLKAQQGTTYTVQ
jgi:hypothetical protein